MVTGGAGFIGSHLVDRLIREDPATIVVVDNFYLGKEANLREAMTNFPSLKVVKQDASNEGKMLKLMHKYNIEIVFNLAVIPLPASLVYPRWVYEHNIDITLTCCELIRKSRFKTLVHFSSSEAYGDLEYAPMDEIHPLKPTTTYGVSKASSDMLVMTYRKLYGIDMVIIRPFNNYGPRQNDGGYAGVIPVTIKRILKGEPPIIYGDGLQTRDFIYVGDTVESAVRIYNCPNSHGRIINLASGSEVTIKQLIKLISEHMGYDRSPIYEPGRDGDLRRLIGAINLLTELTGYEPQTKFDQGLRRTIDWYISTL
jgi:UDP-glucose 4-epimerase